MKKNIYIYVCICVYIYIYVCICISLCYTEEINTTLQFSYPLMKLFEKNIITLLREQQFDFRRHRIC